MSIAVIPLTNQFGAEITGVNLKSLSDYEFSEIRNSFEIYGVLVFRNQSMNDDHQVTFSKRFGPLENTVSVNPAGGTFFARQSNIDMESNEIMDPEDERINYQKGNMLWHADSTFKAMPSLCSILSAREVPPEGGDTEFACTRRVYESLDEVTRERLEGAVVEHDFAWSRARSGLLFNRAQRDEFLPARHPLIQKNPVHGRKSLMIGAHARFIIGWPKNQSRAMLDDLLARATIPENIFVHKWRLGDVIVWDNRAILHRATPFNVNKYRRLMQRTTVSNPDAEVHDLAFTEISRSITK